MDANENQDDPTNHQPLKIKFSLSSIMGLNMKKEGQDADATAGNEGEAPESSPIGNQDESMEDAMDQSVDDGADSSSIQNSNDGGDASNYASQDQFSQSETESNMNDVTNNGDEDDGMDESMDDMDNGDDDSQDNADGDVDNNEEDVPQRRTRSTSIDERDTTEVMENTTSGPEMRSSKKDKDKDEVESFAENKSSRSAAAAERELLGFREPASKTMPTTSFLDSLSEEQRRVRTRHLPDVAGFRRLHKAEIKRDLTGIKKLLKASKGNSKKSTEEEMNKEVDLEKMEVDATAGSEDESQSDVENQITLPTSQPGKGQLSDAKLSGIIENPDLQTIFSMPYNESPYICTDVNLEGKLGDAKPSLFSSPQVVESISAFNPPRPPESVGSKKMHRLTRWERNPQDVEVDLSNYRKTVQRTRQELHKVEDERERIEVVGQHLRANFMTQLQCMKHEMDLMNATYDDIQGQCIKSADLLTSKTRSRGTARGSNVMMDVLSILKTRGDGTNIELSDTPPPSCPVGVGGVGHGSSLGSGWLLPGEKVSTPYGNGTVLNAFGPAPLDPTKAPSNEDEKKSQSDKQDNLNVSVILPSRISVKFPFGIGYFSLSNVRSLETPVSLKDEGLAQRWLAMIESARETGTCVDFEGVDQINTDAAAVVSVDSGMDKEDENMDMSENMESGVSAEDKLLAYGSSLFPSSTNRGAGMEKLSIDQLEKIVSDMLGKSSGVLGAKNHPSVPDAYKKWEHEREELRTLEGQAIQLRNKLYRQRRIRFLNEKNAVSAQKRRDRFEFLLTEMKSDLDMLKDRLKDELAELGIDQDRARHILSEYYRPDSEESDSINGEKRKAEDAEIDHEKSSKMKLNEEGVDFAL
ncbi:hypothetical protein CTEN210_07770 [Chaetoceros tenuissimus]|uniref:Uncharacterized protein n=1 Tax=Chaetoceros tenuissimus TaxID=426638 RepID=A0AAD3CT29_9STRA|nr:hypothetical protein CTEN210_07770 [Chaetoceros tenuissimus]